jgi:hypothetical protein
VSLLDRVTAHCPDEFLAMALVIVIGPYRFIQAPLLQEYCTYWVALKELEEYGATKLRFETVFWSSDVPPVAGPGVGEVGFG